MMPGLMTRSIPYRVLCILCRRGWVLFTTVPGSFRMCRQGAVLVLSGTCLVGTVTSQRCEQRTGHSRRQSSLVLIPMTRKPGRRKRCMSWTWKQSSKDACWLQWVGVVGQGDGRGEK